MFILGLERRFMTYHSQITEYGTFALNEVKGYLNPDPKGRVNPLVLLFCSPIGC